MTPNPAPIQYRFEQRQVVCRTTGTRTNVDDLWVRVPVGAAWRADMRLVLQDGRLVVGELHMFPNDPLLPAGVDAGDATAIGEPWGHSAAWGLDATVPPGGLTARVLRRVNVHAHHRVEPEPLVVHDASGRLRELWGEGELILQQYHSPAPPGRRRGRPPIADTLLLQVAAAYAKAFAAGNARPVQAVAKTFRRQRMSPGRARDLVYRARARGFLDKSSWGVASGRLTPVAQAMLKATATTERKRR